MTRLIKQQVRRAVLCLDPTSLSFSALVKSNKSNKFVVQRFLKPSNFVVQ
jgi:hypothetical protein